MAQIIKKGEGRYQVRVFLGRDQRGTKQFHSRTIQGRLRDATEYATRVQRDRDLGAHQQLTRESVGQYLDKWLATKQVKVRPRTFRDYQLIIERQLKPALGSVRLAKLATGHVQDLINDLSSRGLKPRTVKYAFDVLNMALGFAVKTGLLVRSPCSLVELPPLQRSPAMALSPAEARAFLAAALEDRYAALWVLLLHTGIRPGEALGLRWKDVDFDAGLLSVRHSLTRLDGAGWRLEAPKTPSSYRTIELTPDTTTVLQRQRERQLLERPKAGVTFTDHDLVFTALNGEPLDWRVVARRHFKPIAAAAGFAQLRPYDLRHTSATLALTLNTPIKLVSERLGHSDIKMTLQTYQHVLPGMQRAAADRLAKLLATAQ